MLKKIAVLVAAALFTGGLRAPAYAWEPGDTVELVVPAAKGGADAMIRAIADIIEKNKLTKQKIVVVNKPGGSGAEGYLYIKGKPGSDTLVITLSNIFTLPVTMGTNFKWDELTPLARMALDPFILWVNADTPYKKADDYLAAARAESGKYKMGGTGAAQEDQIVTGLLEQSSKAKFVYVPLKGGGDVAKALAAKEIDSSVNNPSEAEALWKEGKVRPLGLFSSSRMTLPAWKDVPTMKEQGHNVEYVMMRGIFGPPDMKPEAVKYYTALLQKVAKTKEFQDYLIKNGLLNAYIADKEFRTWVAEQDDMHRKLLGTLGLK
ncbi:MAG: tripartite tricarboxylate transporter substrate binding protein [Elusimicrobia bacterium]|nr:tripartite tricarboxylate transporter substrate binding protein [Elusimicrobiota bacterium]